MGRSNYAILAMGLGSVLVMSFLMHYFLKAADTGKPAPLLQELTATYGDRLDSPIVLRMQYEPDGKRAYLTIDPALSTSVHQLARDIGEHVWRRIGAEENLVGVTVECRSLSSKTPLRIPVPRPYQSSGGARSALAPPQRGGRLVPQPAAPRRD